MVRRTTTTRHCELDDPERSAYQIERLLQTTFSHHWGEMSCKIICLSRKGLLVLQYYSKPTVSSLSCHRATLSKTCTDVSMVSGPYAGRLLRRGSNRCFTRLVRASANVRAAGQEKEMIDSLCGTVTVLGARRSVQNGNGRTLCCRV